MISHNSRANVDYTANNLIKDFSAFMELSEIQRKTAIFDEFLSAFLLRLLILVKFGQFSGTPSVYYQQSARRKRIQEKAFNENKIKYLSNYRFSHHRHSILKSYTIVDFNLIWPR